MSDSKSNLIEEILNSNQIFALALIKQKHIKINATDEFNKTALIYSCEYEFEKIALELIGREDCKINIPDENGKTALIHACELKLDKIASALIGRKDCKINIRDENGKTALIHACELKLDKIALELIEKDDSKINEIDVYKKNALMYASEYELENIALILIDKGSNLTLQDEYGISTLMYACQWNMVNIVKKIKETLGISKWKLEKKKINNNNQSALIIACMFNNLECLQIITGREEALNGRSCLNSCKYYDLFQIKFTKDTFTQLYNLGDVECGAICLNTMGFSRDIVIKLLNVNIDGYGIDYYEMQETINDYIKSILSKEPGILEGFTNDKVELISFDIKNVYMIYGYFFNNLSKGYCTIIGFNREDDSGHYMVIAKSYTDTPYMIDTQEYATYRNKTEIIGFLGDQKITNIYLYSSDIKLEPQTFSLFTGNNTYIPERQPTMNNSNTLKLPTPEKFSFNNVFPKKNNRGTKKRERMKKHRGTVTRGATTAGLQRKKKTKRKKNQKEKKPKGKKSKKEKI